MADKEFAEYLESTTGLKVDQAAAEYLLGLDDKELMAATFREGNDFVSDEASLLHMLVHIQHAILKEMRRIYECLASNSATVTRDHSPADKKEVPTSKQ